MFVVAFTMQDGAAPRKDTPYTKRREVICLDMARACGLGSDPDNNGCFVYWQQVDGNAPTWVDCSLMELQQFMRYPSPPVTGSSPDALIQIVGTLRREIAMVLTCSNLRSMEGFPGQMGWHRLRVAVGPETAPTPPLEFQPGSGAFPTVDPRTLPKLPMVPAPQVYTVPATPGPQVRTLGHLLLGRDGDNAYRHMAKLATTALAQLPAGEAWKIMGAVVEVLQAEEAEKGKDPAHA